MTPNGAIAVAFIMIALAIAGPGPRGFAVLLVLAAGFAIVEVRGATWTALRRAAVVVVPLAAFMGFIWVGIVGRAPAEIAADVPGTRAAALIHVLSICLRLFFVVTVIQLAVLIWLEMLLARSRFIPALSFVEQPPTYTETHAVQRFEASLSGFSTVWNYLAVMAMLFWLLFYAL